MRKVSVSLNDELAGALTSYIDDRPDSPGATEVMRAALCEYLVTRGYIQRAQRPGDRRNNSDDAFSTVSDDSGRNHMLEAMEAYLDAQSATPPAPPSVLVVLRTYLQTLGVSMPAKPLLITPAETGSGHSDTSIEHDRVLAELHQ